MPGGVEFILYELEEIWQSFAFPSLKGEALSARRVIDEDAQSPFNVMPNLITQNTIRAIQSIDASNDRHGDFLMRLLAFTVGIGPPLMVASAQSDIFVFAIGNLAVDQPVGAICDSLCSTHFGNQICRYGGGIRVHSLVRTPSSHNGLEIWNPCARWVRNAHISCSW